MSTNYETELVRRVYDNDNGHCITVRQSTDFPGNVLLLTEPTEEEYFGKLRLDLPASFMRQIALALMHAVEEAEKKE